MEQVRVGLIGCGGFTRYRISNLQEVPEAKIVALVDTDSSQLEKTKAQYPDLAALPTFSDHNSMLKEVGVDAVEIATPHTLHTQQILDCLAAGKHVLTEKPMVTSVADSHAVIQARDKAGKVGMVSYQRHFQPEFRYIRTQLESGAVGAVQFVQALLGQGWKKGTAGSWRQIPELSGGGQLNDSGSHMLDVLLWVTGLKARRVAAFCNNCDTPVDINTSMSVAFDGGALGSFSIVGDAQEWYEDTTIWCERGTFYIRRGKLTVVDGSGNRWEAENLPGGSTPDQNFVDAILGRAEVQSPFECGLRVMELTEAAWQSSANGGAAVVVA